MRRITDTEMPYKEILINAMGSRKQDKITKV